MNYSKSGGEEMDAAKPAMKVSSWIVICVILLLVGCETPPSVVEENFGSSVRNAIALQTAQPGEKVPTLDGVKGDAVLRGYQADVVNQKEAGRELIQINVNN